MSTPLKSPISDFPDWLGPMLVKELRQGLKTRGFVLSFVGLQAILVIVLIYHVLLYSQDAHGFDATGLGVIFWMLIGGLLLIVTPARAFNELASERKANTLELIFMSGLSAWRITAGKWVSLMFQALLFLLAVLPYAILRYYFGAVDLAQDLSSMLVVFLCCALLSASALALSGMPFWVRLIVAVFGTLFTLFTLMASGSAFMFGGVFGRASMLSWTADTSWLLVAWDFVLLCLITLEIGAQTIAPAAENHAGRQRFLALLLWLPLPAMHALKASDGAMFAQLWVFGLVAGVLVWYGLSTVPDALHAHSRPFAGWRALFGLPFQPGWPSAVLFALFEVALFEFTLRQVISHGAVGDLLIASHLMGAAALFCACFFWRILRRRARHPFVEQILFLILCSVAVVLLLAGKPSGTHLGSSYFFGLLPPMAVWAMLDQPYPTAAPWGDVAALALAGYAVALLLLSWPYWAQYFRFCRDAARPTVIPST